jgi:hypothetical protein
MASGKFGLVGLAVGVGAASVMLVIACIGATYFKSVVAAVRANPGRLSAPSVSQCKSVCMGILFGRAGRLTAKNGDFRPGQVGKVPLWAVLGVVATLILTQATVLFDDRDGHMI